MATKPVDPFAGSPTFQVANALMEDNGRGPHQRKKPRYPSEARRIKATYDLATDPAIRGDIKEISARFGVTTGRLVCALLRHGLERFEAGELDVEKVVFLGERGNDPNAA